MITNFQKIKKVGCYDEFTFNPKELKTFKKVNVIYGNNGSGKTTFSNLLFLLSKNCKEKASLLSELIDIDSELEIITNSGKVTHKNILDKNLDLYVFNSKFISDHVYNGTTANVDPFSGDVKLTSPEIEIIEAELTNLEKRFSKLSRWRSQIEAKLEGIFKSYNEEFQKKISGARLSNVKPAITTKQIGDLGLIKAELGNLYKEYLKKSKESDTIDKFSLLSLKIESIIEIDIDIAELGKKLQTKISSDAKGKVGARIEFLQKSIDSKGLKDSLGDLTDWFKKGGRLLHISKTGSKHCPLCDTNLSNALDSILSDYSNYFSDSLVELFDFMTKSQLTLASFIDQKQFEKNEVICAEIVAQCKSIFNFDLEPLVFEDGDRKVLEEALLKISESLNQKKQNPETECLLNPGLIEIINAYKTKIESFKSSASEKVAKEIASLQSKTLDSIVREIKNKIGALSSLELNQIINSVLPPSKKLNSDVALICDRLSSEINTKIAALQLEKISEITKLNAESKYINIYLKHFGISHFEIDRDKVKTENNLVITYKSGKKKTNLNHSLSEGEKTALAFAYFISKLRVEKIEGSANAFENCIIVIDDPISSLDDNRLFQTANLIDSFLFYNKPVEEDQSDDSNNFNHHPCQVFILSHNLTFIKYLHNALRSNGYLKEKINEYYLSHLSPRIKKLPTGLKNFTNTYIIKLKEIIDFRDKKLEYEQVKNYLPNYIRIVLETFLSFKLAIVNDSNDRLPGLSHLINGMVKEFDLIDDVTIGVINKDGAIKRLNHLKKIADHESHGSIYRAEEFAFISEAELRDFAKNTTQVVEFIDNLHFTKIKGHL